MEAASSIWTEWVFTKCCEELPNFADWCSELSIGFHSAHACLSSVRTHQAHEAQSKPFVVLPSPGGCELISDQNRNGLELEWLQDGTRHTWKGHENRSFHVDTSPLFQSSLVCSGWRGTCFAPRSRHVLAALATRSRQGRDGVSPSGASDGRSRYLIEGRPCLIQPSSGKGDIDPPSSTTQFGSFGHH